MGIPKFAYFISTRYPLIVKKIKEKIDVPEIDNFYLDLNSVIHNVSHGNSILISCQNRKYEDIYQDVCESTKNQTLSKKYKYDNGRIRNN